jgi:hypothetical protein
VDCRQAISIGKRNDLLVMNYSKNLRHHDEAAGRFAAECADHLFHLGLIVNLDGDQLDAICCGSGLGRTKEGSHIGSCLRVEHESNPPDARRDVFEHLHPFAAQGRLVGHEPGDHATWMRQA